MLQQAPHRRTGVSIRWFPKDLQLSHKTVRWGESRQRGIKVEALLFTCIFALAVSQSLPCQSRVRVLSAGVITFEHCMAKKPTHARRVGEGSGIGSALLSLRVPQGLLRTERRQYVTVTDSGSSVPCHRGLCRRMPVGFTGLGVPGWCPAPWSAGRRYRLPQQQINASPPSLHPTRPSHHPGGRRGRGPGRGGVHPVVRGRRCPSPAPSASWGRGGWMGRCIPLIPFPWLPVGGPGPSKRGNN